MKRWFVRIVLGLLGILGLLVVGLLVLFFRAQPLHPVHKTVTHDKSLPHQTIDGVTFHLRSFGKVDALPIIVIHGGPGGDFRSLLPLKVLAKDGYRVIFYDQRGTGLSPRVAASTLTLPSSVDDLHRIVKWAGKGKPVALFGHSWGGIIAAYYLAKHPKNIQAAILAEPGVLTSQELQDFVKQIQPKMNAKSLWYLVNTILQANKVKGPDKEAQGDYLFGRMMYMPGDSPLKAYWCNHTPHPTALQHWRAGSTASKAILGTSKKPDGSFFMPSLKGLQQYKHEVLLMAGSCNTLIGPKRQKAHLKLFPKASLQVIPNAGHMMHLDKPKLTRHAILSFLKKRGYQTK